MRCKSAKNAAIQAQPASAESRTARLNCNQSVGVLLVSMRSDAKTAGSGDHRY